VVKAYDFIINRMNKCIHTIQNSSLICKLLSNMKKISEGVVETYDFIIN